MKILHTSDWHLGKQLEGHFRYDEQSYFIEQIYNLCEQHSVDMVIIAGDIYDNSNPPAEAEKLFYRAVSQLADGGKRPVVVVAGNHDNPLRLAAASPLAYDDGIILIGTPKTIVETGVYKSFEIYESGTAYFKMKLNGEKLTFIAMPYPSEKRLDEVFLNLTNESEMQQTYSDKIKQILSMDIFEDDSITIAAAHLFMLGGEPEGSERTLSLGGGLLVNSDVFPKQVQYAALGHIHKYQRIKDNIIYSGAPMRFDRSDSKEKYIILSELFPNKEVITERIKLHELKPIEQWKANSYEEALQMCKQNKEHNAWVYLEIESERFILQSEIKELRDLRTPLFISVNAQSENEEQTENIYRLSEAEQFMSFYKKQRNTEPNEELVNLFLEMLGDE